MLWMGVGVAQLQGLGVGMGAAGKATTNSASTRPIAGPALPCRRWGAPPGCPSCGLCHVPTPQGLRLGRHHLQAPPGAVTAPGRRPRPRSASGGAAGGGRGGHGAAVPALSQRGQGPRMLFVGIISPGGLKPTSEFLRCPVPVGSGALLSRSTAALSGTGRNAGGCTGGLGFAAVPG